MKLIQSIETGTVFINLFASKHFRSNVTIDMELQVIVCKHSADNQTHGKADGRWKVDCVEVMDYTVKSGKKLLDEEKQKVFLSGNKAAGIDYVSKAIKAVEAEIEILGVDELALQAGIILKDDETIPAPLKELNERLAKIDDGQWYVIGCSELCNAIHNNANRISVSGLNLGYGYFKDVVGSWTYDRVENCEANGRIELSVEEFKALGSK